LLGEARRQPGGFLTGSIGHREARGKYLATLCVGALGIVYGDIGTSPLYSLRECFYGAHSIAVSQQNVLGVLSLIFWSLIIIVTLKYHVYVLHFDNRGEGGILALISLIGVGRRRIRGAWLLMGLGVFGAALLYGDGIITPAISVLSAVEGLEVATPRFGGWVVPITVVILLGLFLLQKRGTAGIGAIFGPVMLVWFATLAVLGVAGILREPSVLRAVNPAHAIAFFTRNGVHGFLVLGAVFLVATGGEALYADLGHFGERPIQIDWFTLVGPSLLLNYFGQGALLIRAPDSAHNPFYRMAPGWALYPLVILATLATIIASQAVISGAFSLTRQAVQLGYLPRVRIDHTSAREIGQIYIPSVNWTLMAATIAIVVGFRTSSNLAAAYGVAVTTTMVITTILAGVVSRKRFGWPLAVSLAVTSGFLFVDLAFFGANMVKVAHGGWFALVVAAFVFTVMTTWRRGREIVDLRTRRDLLPIEVFLEDVARGSVPRVEGTAVYMSRTTEGVPPQLLHNLKHNKVLHKTIVFLTVKTAEEPHVSTRKRLEAAKLGHGIFRIVGHYGYMDEADVPELLSSVRVPGLTFPPNDTSFFLGKETIFATRRPGMAIWRERLFAVMSRNSRSATLYFNLPPNRVVELGAQIEI
jgi:KUP system potassium uptake protein